MNYILLLFLNFIIVQCVEDTGSSSNEETDYSEEGSESESREDTKKNTSIATEIPITFLKSINFTSSSLEESNSSMAMAYYSFGKPTTENLPTSKKNVSAKKYMFGHSIQQKWKQIQNYSSLTLVRYPFAVSILRKGAHYATGALLNKNWILSSAREFYHIRETIKLLRARLGSVNCKKGGILLPLIKVEIHPSYVHGLPNFDLSLLRIAKPFEYTRFIKPVALSKIKNKVISGKFMTTYWSRLIIDGETLPTNAKERLKQHSLRVSKQHLIPKNKCVVMFENSTLLDSTLCLKPYEDHHSICLPDAGAPVLSKDGLWGITSGWTSKDCLENPTPTLFTRVSSKEVTSWLDPLIADAKE